ncbi:hypothetical protein ACOMICROBIO_NCLOACGD_03422 [Vibrio sp. B1ASS3]|uniref:HAD family hydrolase n=1 Tax=Vibrio sp. B1ASS3 TaxID=2751176 RepID=UPI001ABBCA17|nr:HAD family hydrolase [Vibrio sp. B1ASS3]CAD7817576.1 hypothetical protein ACOMICROBIO_NCLOACGD_03422 [Vibrio sp. B1ASS3]CAE6931769.1 hypothetical protein ACOMICROBIO_NCLOACGD_03422 [Vibrio sp. B1ASS3]
MKQLVILDLDDTIYSERDYFSGVFSSYEQANELDSGSLLRAFDSINRKESRDILREALTMASSYTPQNHDLLFLLYSTAEFAINLPQSSSRFLEILKSNQIRTAVLTNGVVDVQKNKVRNLGLEAHVDKVFYARENSEKYEKPDIRCFQNVLEFFDCKPENALMIGDSYNNDYLGGRNAQIASLWLHGNNSESIQVLEEAIPFIFGTKQ